MNEDSDTPKEEKQERLSRHKETMQRSQAEEEAQLLNQQRLVYERSCRALKRRSLIKKHEFEQEQIREASNNRSHNKKCLKHIVLFLWILRFYLDLWVTSRLFFLRKIYIYIYKYQMFGCMLFAFVLFEKNNSFLF